MDLKDLEASTNFTQEELLNFFSVPRNVSGLEDYSSLRVPIIITCYSIVIAISVFGNLLVCNIVRRASMWRTTYVFIANLALSDLLMTVLNIPFNVTRVLMSSWPFGSFMCSFVPLVQATSVYVSTFTMMFIALDRYRVICKPLMPRLSPLQALKAIGVIWLVAIILALPHGVFNKIETIYTFRTLIRCRSVYPHNMSQWITLITVCTQYFFPLSVTGMAYFFIVARVWSRDVLGVVTEAQIITQARAKKKTIKMLVLVVILFALCWLPLNVYHLVHEFTDLDISYKTPTVYFICHWLAMSSVCYNPFIYCWLNKNFRSGAVTCFICLRNVGRKVNSSFRSTREIRLTDTRFNFTSQSFDSRFEMTDTVMPIRDVSCCFRTTSNNKYQQQQRKDVHRLNSLQSRKSAEREAKPVSAAIYTSRDSVSVFAQNRRNKFYSMPEIKNAVPDSTKEIKKCLSWGQ